MISEFTTLLMLFSIINNTQELQPQCIFTIIKEFNMNDPYFIGAIENKIQFFKFMSKTGQFLNIHSRMEELSVNEKFTTNSIILLNSQTRYYQNQLDFPNNPNWSFLLISKDSKFEELLDTVAAQIYINQNIFILNENSYEIYEAYKINNVIVKMKLGHIDLISNNFVWQKGVIPNFIKRRSNFHGIVLNGIVGFSGLEMFAKDSRYREMVPYFQNNGTHLVNGFTDGLYHDILMTLQDRLNFTTKLYKKKKDIWGHISSKNGTSEGIGMIGDIFFKRADIALAPFTMTIERASFVDYLPPIKPTIVGMYIPITNRYIFDFETYLTPFSLILWMTVAFTGVTFAAWKYLLLKIHNRETIFGFDHVWTSFSGFVGGTPTATPIDKKPSYKTTILATMLCGTVVWIAYTARLTSELSIHKKKYPFHDMESVSKTNWR